MNDEQRLFEDDEPVQQDFWGFADHIDNSLLSHTMPLNWKGSPRVVSDDHGVISFTGEYPATEEDAQRLKALRIRAVNDAGAFFVRSEFDGATDEALVWMVTEPRGVPEDARRAAGAELDRRHTDAMRKSSSASYWLASAMLLVALAQVLLIVWQLANP